MSDPSSHNAHPGTSVAAVISVAVSRSVALLPQYIQMYVLAVSSRTWTQNCDSPAGSQFSSS